MAKTGFIIGWKDVKPGREHHAAELYASTVAFYERKVREKIVESFEPVLLARHGGDLNGFFLVRGELDQLNRLRQSEEYLDFTARAVHCLESFGVVECYLGHGIQDLMTRWQKSTPS